MGIVNHEDSPSRQYQRSVLPVVLQLVPGLLRPSGQEEQVAGIVAMNQMDGQSQSDDGVQGGRGYQVATMEYGLRTKRLGFGDRCGERFTMVMAVGNYADFQVSPPLKILPQAAQSIFYAGINFFLRGRLSA
jgi:hypothetical protein